MTMSICNKYNDNTSKIYDCKRKNNKGCQGCEYHLYDETTSANWDMDSLARAVESLMRIDKKK